MPPKVHKGRTLDKNYFWTVVNTVLPEEVDAILKHANELRNAVSGDKQKQSAILVSEEMSELLFKYPWIR